MKIITLLSCFIFCNTFAQDGILDTTFGTNGVVTTGIVNSYNHILAIRIQPDDKIVIGTTAHPSETESVACLLRYLPDGTPDPEFGNNGHTTIAFDFNVSVNDIVLHNGQILAAGGASGENAQFGAFRFNPDGSPDISFGNQGAAIIPVPNYSMTQAWQISVQSDGKIILGGFAAATELDTNHALLARLNPDGSPDTDFGNQGILIDAQSNAIETMQLLPDAKVLTFTPSYNSFHSLRRYDTNGTIDTSYGDSGIAPGYLQNQQLFPMTATADGAALMAGTMNDFPTINRISLTKHTPTGAMDASFGVNGSVLHTTETVIAPRDIKIQPDGKIVVGGNNGLTDLKFGIERFNSDGSFDSSFGSGGITITELGMTNFLHHIALQNDGKIVAVGKSDNQIVLTRYTNQILSKTDFKKSNGTVVVYPNPITDILHFDREATQLFIYDAQGRCVKNNEALTDMLDVSDLDAGVYLLSFLAGGILDSQKIIKR